MKKVIQILLVFVLALNIPVNAFASSETSIPNINEQAFQSLGKEEVKEFILNSQSAYYNVLGINFTDSNIVYTSDKVSFKTNAEVSEVLKATDVEGLPYIKGVLKALGVSSYISLTPSQKTESVLNKTGANNAISDSSNNLVASKIVKAIDQEFNDVQSYIGKTTKINMSFIISINTADIKNISKNTIKISGLDSLDNEVNVNEFNLRSSDEMNQSGINDFNSMISDFQTSANMVHLSLVPINDFNAYDRIAARDYAYSWWGPTDMNYNHNYTNYNYPQGGDCANFVSQCIYAGGVPTSTYWLPDSTYWIGAANLKNYMVNNGYASLTSYTNTNAGNFAYTTAGTGHIVLVTKNDTVNICYTAHNFNREDEPFTQSALNGGFSFYVIKNTP